MLLLLLIEAFIILNSIYCLKQRKFYKEYSTELKGTVVSWKKMASSGGRITPVYYALMVHTEQGTYYVESNSRKARKYKECEEVTILVVPHTPLPELPPETLADLTPEQLAALEKVRAAESKTDALERKLTILKDDLKRMSEVVFCIVAGVFFGVLFVAAVVDRFI